MFLSTILWGVYVYFTIKTFNEIKKQTDLQTRAFLIITPTTCNQSELKEYPKYHPDVISLNEKWRGIIKTNFPMEVSVSKVFCLKIKNRGKSDVYNWNLTIEIKIEPGVFLHSKFNISGETITIEINSHKTEQIIPPDGEQLILISPLGFFPKSILKWDIKYVDIRGETYNSFSGDSDYTNTNDIIFEYKDVPSDNPFSDENVPF
jgi:hypothetical protein